MMKGLGGRLGCGVQVAAKKPERQLTEPLMGWFMVQPLRPDQVIVLASTDKGQWA